MWDIVPVDILEGGECDVTYEKRFDKAKYWVNNSHLVDGKIKVSALLNLYQPERCQTKLKLWNTF